MAIKINFKDLTYPDICRGTSVRIPFFIKYSDDTQFDVVDYDCYFTLKQVRGDYDYFDDRAFIEKTFTQDISDPLVVNRFNIDLTPKETYIPWGDYYFDIEILHRTDGTVNRLATFKVKIVEGPTNRSVDASGTGTSGIVGDAISAILTETAPIILIAPLVGDPPSSLVETLSANPSYILDNTYPRNPVINVYGPKISFTMNVHDLNDGAALQTQYNLFNPGANLPSDFPMKGKLLEVQHNRISFDVTGVTEMEVYETWSVTSPPDFGSNHFIGAYQDYYVHEDVDAGFLNVRLQFGNNKVIHITGNYHVPRTLNIDSYWLLKIDYYNWN